MSDYLISEETLTNIANAIRSKTGTTAKINPTNMNNNVGNIVTLNEGTIDATAVSADLLSGKTAYVDGDKITGTMTNNGAVSPSALNAGSSYTIPAGYHNGSGKVTANNLASQTSATAAAADILSGKTAWVNGNKITGVLSKISPENFTASSTNVYYKAGATAELSITPGEKYIIFGASSISTYNTTGTKYCGQDVFYLDESGNITNIHLSTYSGTLSYNSTTHVVSYRAYDINLFQDAHIVAVKIS